MTVKLPPTPKGTLILGHLSEYRKDSLGYEKYLASNYGDVVHIRWVNRHAYLISHPDDVRKVLVDEAGARSAPLGRRGSSGEPQTTGRGAESFCAR